MIHITQSHNIPFYIHTVFSLCDSSMFSSYYAHFRVTNLKYLRVILNTLIKTAP